MDQTESHKRDLAAHAWTRRLVLFVLTVLVIGGVVYSAVAYTAHVYFTATYDNPDLFATDDLAISPRLIAPREVTLNPEVSHSSDINHDWPCLFGPSHDSTAPDQPLITTWSVTGPPVLWRVAAGAGYASPVGQEQRVLHYYRRDDEEIVTCRELETGHEIWSSGSPTNYRCSVAYTNGPYSTPLIDEGAVYTIGAEGRLRCLDFKTGVEIWSRDLKTEFGIPDRTYGVGHTPAIWRNLLIVNVGGTIGTSGIVAFEKTTGAVVWSSTTFGASYATPRIMTAHDREWVIVLTQQALVSLTPDRGDVVWSIPFESSMLDGENAVTPLIYGDLILACSYGTGSICLRVLPDGSHAQIWESRRQLTSQYISPIVHQGYVYGIHTDFSLRCIQLTTGQLLWRHKGELLRSNQILVNGRLIALGERGHLACFSATPDSVELISHTEQSVLDFEGHCFQAPALIQGRLLVGSERELVCLDLRPVDLQNAATSNPREAVSPP